MPTLCISTPHDLRIKGGGLIINCCAIFSYRAFIEFPRQAADHKFVVSPAVLKALKMR